MREYGVVGSGVEDDRILLERAEERLRVIGMLERVHDTEFSEEEEDRLREALKEMDSAEEPVF